MVIDLWSSPNALPEQSLLWVLYSSVIFVSFLLLPVHGQLRFYLFLIVMLCLKPFSYAFCTLYPLTQTNLRKIIHSSSLFENLPLPSNLLFPFLYEGKYEIAFIFPPPPMGRSQGCFIIKLVLW